MFFNTTTIMVLRENQHTKVFLQIHILGRVGLDWQPAAPGGGTVSSVLISFVYYYY